MTKWLVLISFFIFSSLNSQSLPKVFDVAENQTLTHYELKKFYQGLNLPPRSIDSLAQVFTKQLKKDSNPLFLINEITRMSMLGSSGNIREALLAMNKLKTHDSLLKKPFYLGTYSTVLGGIYFAMIKPDEARKNYKIAVRNFILAGDSIGIKGNTINVGNTFALIEQSDSALYYYEQANELEKLGVREFHFSLQNNLAKNYADMGFHDKAVHIDEDLLFNQFNNLTFSEFTTMSLNLGRHYKRLKKHKRAINVFENGINVAEENSLIQALSYLYRDIAESYKALSEHEKAYNYLRKGDSVDLIINDRSLEEAAAQIKIEHQKIMFEKEAELKAEQSRIEKTNHDKELKNEKNRQSMLILFSIVLAVLLSIIIYLYLKKRSKNRLLVKQNVELAKKISKDYSPAKSNKEIKQTSPLLKAKIESALVDEELFKDPKITVELLSKKLDTNRTYLTNAFNELYDESFRSLINKLRVNEARRLLIDPKYNHYSIEGIASEVGYRNLSSFNSAFKKETGITPSYFRNNHSIL